MNLPRQANSLLAAAAATAGVLCTAAGSFAGPGSSTAESGPVSLSDLYTLAMEHDSELRELRGDVIIAEWEKRAVKDWRDPEVRLGWSYSSEDLGDPYTRKVEERTIEKGSERLNRSGTNNGEPESTRRNERSRSETIQRTTETVVPGSKFDETITETREITKTRINGDEIHRDNNPNSERYRETQSEKVRSQSVEREFHPWDPTAGEDGFSASIRFFLPHPWERKARLEEAAAEIDLVHAKIREREREIILDVREAYEELQFRNRELQSAEELIKVLQEQADSRAEMIKAGFETIDKGTSVKANLSKAKLEVLQSRQAYITGVAEIARLCGVDPKRIVVAKAIENPQLDIADLDAEYLVSMAFVKHPRALEILSRLNLSKSELKQIKAKRIPWPEFIELGGSWDNRLGGEDQTEYGVRLSFSLPIASLFVNKEHKVREAEIQQYSEALEHLRLQLQRRIAAQLTTLRDSGAMVTESNKLYGDLLAEFADDEAKSEGAGLMARKIKAENDEARLELEIVRLKTLEEHREQILELEKILGMDLDDVFAGEVGGSK
ncbi:MAG: TolC family protein [Verrucomicrobiales bacterium]